MCFISKHFCRLYLSIFKENDLIQTILNNFAKSKVSCNANKHHFLPEGKALNFGHATLHTASHCVTVDP